MWEIPHNNADWDCSKTPTLPRHVNTTPHLRKREFSRVAQLCTNFPVVHKFIPMPGAKTGVEEEWEKLEKILAWQPTEVRNKREVIADARGEGKTILFSSLMDICHLKNSELEPQFQKYNGGSGCTPR